MVCIQSALWSLLHLLSLSKANDTNEGSNALSTPITMPSLMPKTVVRPKDQPLIVSDLVAPMYATHASTINQSYEWRMNNLRKLRKLHTEHEVEFKEALRHDLGKDHVEASITELKLNLAEIDYFIKNLKSLMTPKQVASPGYNAICFSQVEHRPLTGPGVLIIGASNYPLNLCFAPAAGALAGGNPVVLKPSEQTPATSNLLAKLVKEYFDEGSLQVVEGGVEVTSELVKQSWGKLVFTGSERVGRIVAEAAARTLTPVILELGGKSPCYVDEFCPNIKLVAHRIIWGKTINIGQTCVCPDYIVVHESHKEQLVKELVAAIHEQFGEDVQISEIGRLAQESHAERLVDLIKDAEQRDCDVIGGSAKCDTKDRFVYPTIVVDPPKDSRVIKEEIFGPVLPIVTVKSRKEAQDFINGMYGTPLSMYVFTKKASVYRDMLRVCPAASSIRNDVMVHFGNPQLPMSGLGSSGYGAYHGMYSWRAFTHAQSQVYRPIYYGSDFGGIRCHPFKGLREKLVMAVTDLPPIPPLHLRKFAVLGVVAFGFSQVPALRLGLADALVSTADWLRKA